MYIHAERLLAKAGVARRNGRGLPTGAERRRPKAGLHKRSAEDWGYPCAARLGQSPLAHGPSAVRYCVADDYRVGVAGGNGPLRRVTEDALTAGVREETSSIFTCNISLGLETAL